MSRSFTINPATTRRPTSNGLPGKERYRHELAKKGNLKAANTRSCDLTGGRGLKHLQVKRRLPGVPRVLAQQRRIGIYLWIHSYLYRYAAFYFYKSTQVSKIKNRRNLFEDASMAYESATARFSVGAVERVAFYLALTSSR